MLSKERVFLLSIYVLCPVESKSDVNFSRPELENLDNP